MNIQEVPISKVKLNEDNPRVIRDEKFEKLKRSIEKFPKMLDLRPIVVDKNMVVLGGNMRLRACAELGHDMVPVVIADDLTPEEKQEFIIKDNVGFGDWDWEALANEWDDLPLDDWGLDIPNYDDIDVDDFFNEKEDENNESPAYQIILDYTEEEYNIIMEKLNNIKGSKESIIYNLLIDK